MTLDTLIMLAGAFVAVLPFLGFPSSWDTVLFFLAGVFVVCLGIVLRRRNTENNSRQGNGDTFVENLQSRQQGEPR